MVDTTETWLTAETHAQLTAELADRSGPGRLAISARIEAARAEGDLRENGGYHAAKDEQGHNEARIRQLQQLLEKARVGTAPVSEDGLVGQGHIVTVRFADGETETFLLGSREEARHLDLTVYSPASPLGQALIGQAVGDTVSYALPNGRTMTVDIVAVDPYLG